MSLERDLQKRSNGVCELCASEENVSPFLVEPKSSKDIEDHANLCQHCQEQILDKSKMDANHWRCLNDSMWNENPAVQVLAWRMLQRLKSEGWPQDLLDMLYLDEDTLKWAEATGEGVDDEDKVIHRDANGAILENGDSVVLVKDLVVKGANFTAKRGTAVRNISLVHDNPEHIEGRVNGQHIVILTKFVKK
ncbi:PhnA domain-containing protein [Flammeovirga yaeyamensis]|uniref:PhnA domain-containing protein n=1 Tax=Flammeovirga yaeyamensis TaxID=367791 RepID=A0AAX1N791_9BACT|nr:alkylphosphonate utilization protein [Flammeovirga yaeyamensis]MBB3697978.1 protein PhnA [Flammeovirga yaeyamensis]NMF35670.1 PhnA protein [Flammeovirga yaeyamensis]QWG03375.1 PhnA domain-containing protein [Flammeovirga yaeyamensis]